MVTSNHIHLVILDNKGERVIPEAIQLIAGRTGQGYNQRKSRKGAFWEDRYHATAVETDSHLIQCLIYVDLNMIRAGVVSHPSEWPFCGYNEIQNPRQRHSIIDHESLMDLLETQSIGDLKEYKSSMATGNSPMLLCGGHCPRALFLTLPHPTETSISELAKYIKTYII